MSLFEYSQEIRTSLRNRDSGYRTTLFSVVLAASFMLLLLLMTDLFASDVLIYLRNVIASSFNINVDENRYFREVYALGMEMLITVITMLLPVIFLRIRFRGGKGACTAPRKAPFAIWAYIPFAIGSGYVITLLVQLLGGSYLERFSGGSGSLPETVPGIIMYYILVAVFPAIFEEIAFRGTFMRLLLPYGSKQAIVISAVIFGAMHVNPPQALFACSFGLIIGWLYYYTGSIWWGSLIHMLVNAISVTAGYLYSNFGEESDAVMIFSLAVILLMLSAIAFGIVMLVKYNKSNKKVRIQDVPKTVSKTISESLRSLIHGKCAVSVIFFLVLLASTLITRYFMEDFIRLFGGV